MKKVLMILFCIVMTGSMTAQNTGKQNNRQHHEFSPELYRMKMEQFITRQAGLTAAEGQKFFPMLHEMMELQRKNKDLARDAMHACGENASESDYQKAIDQALNYDWENYKIEKAYMKKFHTVLTWKKIYKAKEAVTKFQFDAIRRFSPPRQNGDGQTGAWPWKKNMQKEK